MRIEEQGNGTEAAVRPGEALEIALAENRTTGFRWRLLSDGAPVLRLEVDRYHAPQGPPGAAGRHVWLMRVATAGDAVVELGYARSWEGGEPARRFSLRVKSRGP